MSLEKEEEEEIKIWHSISFPFKSYTFSILHFYLQEFNFLLVYKNATLWLKRTSCQDPLIFHLIEGELLYGVQLGVATRWHTHTDNACTDLFSANGAEKLHHFSFHFQME